MKLNVEVQMNHSFYSNFEDIVVNTVPIYDFSREIAIGDSVAILQLDYEEDHPTFCVGEVRGSNLKLYFPINNTQPQDQMGKEVVKSVADYITKRVAEDGIKSFVFDLRKKRFILYSDFTVINDVPEFKDGSNIFCIIFNSKSDDDVKKMLSNDVVSKKSEIKFLRLKDSEMPTDRAFYRGIIGSRFVLSPVKEEITGFGTIFYTSLLEYTSKHANHEEFDKSMMKLGNYKYLMDRYARKELCMSSFNDDMAKFRGNELIKRVFKVGDEKKSDKVIDAIATDTVSIPNLNKTTTNVLLSTIIDHGFDVVMRKLDSSKRINVTIDAYYDTIERMEIIEGVLRVKLRKNIKDPYSWLEDDIISSSNFVITS